MGLRQQEKEGCGGKEVGRLFRLPAWALDCIDRKGKESMAWYGMSQYGMLWKRNRGKRKKAKKKRKEQKKKNAMRTLLSSSSACRRTFASADKVPTMRLRMASAFIFYLSSSSFPCVLPLLFLFWFPISFLPPFPLINPLNRYRGRRR